MKWLIQTLAALAILSGPFCEASHAFVATTFDNSTDFFAAAGGGLATEDFEDIGFVSNNQSFDPSHPNLEAGISFSGDNLEYFDDTFGYPQIQTVQLFSNSSTSNIVLGFAPQVTALGFDIVSWPGGSVMTVQILDDLGVTHTFNPDATATNPAYFGIVGSAGSIQQATLLTGDVTVGVDNISFGQARPVIPEPSTLAIWGMLGGLGLIAARRRRKRVA